MAEPVAITVQATPNPNAAKFTLNRVVATRGMTYRDAVTAQEDWARQLLDIPGVTQVFALNNFVTVNKAPDAEWGVIGPQIEQVLRRTFV